uniref:CHK kinase-like domain-containing protein n=1 Tax=Lygus hesperus TaxID=30085 RepID=A0A0K8SQ03_LYGHE
MKNGEKRNITPRALEVAPDGFRRTLLLESGVFEKSYLVYTQVVPRMKDLMKAAGDTSEPLFLDLMDAKNGSYVVFKIPEFGWSTASSENMIPTLPDLALALRSLAKWHAMGAVLLEKGQIPKQQFSERLPMTLANKYASAVLNDFADVVRDTWGKQWTRLAQQMKETVPKVDQIFRIIFNRTNEQDAFNVFNYGDFLGHDMWFNYGITDAYRTDHPIAIKFQYFETTHINTPATDVHHVIFSTPSTRIALKHKDDLIENVYYPALIGYLSKYGYGGNKLTLKRLKDELRQSELYAVITSMTLIMDVFENTPIDFAMLEETWKTGKVSTNTTGKVSSNVTGKVSSGMFHRGFTDAMKPVMEYARDRNVFGGREMTRIITGADRNQTRTRTRILTEEVGY